jgi:hypothetical protein
MFLLMDYNVIRRVLFPALLGLILCSCSSSRLLLSDGVPAHPEVKYREVVRPAKVIGSVVAPEDRIVYDTLGERLYPRLVQGEVPEVVTFDSAGGVIDVERQVVTGTSAEGSPFKEGFVNLLFLQVKETDLAKKFVSPLNFTCDAEELLAAPHLRIRQGSSACWDVVVFDKHGGRYDSASQAIVGVSRHGTAISVDLSDVIHARYDKRDIYKTTRLGLVVCALFVFANGAFHFWDLY